MRAASTEPVIGLDTAREAVRRVSGRVVTLLADHRSPGAHAVGEWTAAETALHLSFVYLADTMAVAARHSDVPMPGLPENVGEGVAALNAATIADDPERDPRRLAARIEERAADFLVQTEDAGAGEPVRWLGGVTLPLCAVVCHLLEEALVHGIDIARAGGRRWPIDGADAALVMEGFFAPAMAAFGPRTFVDQSEAAGLKASYEIRLRGAGRLHLQFDDGEMRVARDTDGRADCIVSADPATFLLLLMNRIKPGAAMARQGIAAWGRKPLLAPKLMRLLQTP